MDEFYFVYGSKCLCLQYAYKSPHSLCACCRWWRSWRMNAGPATLPTIPHCRWDTSPHCPYAITFLPIQLNLTPVFTITDSLLMEYKYIVGINVMVACFTHFTWHHWTVWLYVNHKTSFGSSVPPAVFFLPALHKHCSQFSTFTKAVLT